MRKLLLLLFLALVCNANAQTTVLTNAEQMPLFPGCEHTHGTFNEKRNCSNQILVHFIAENMQYPELAKANNLEGTVIASFVVDENGKVGNIDLIRDIGGGCGKAAVDVLQQMPNWQAGIHEGKAVKVKMNIPIHFSIAKDENTFSDKHKIVWGKLVENEIGRKDLKKYANYPIQVRDVEGNDLLIEELIFAFEKNGKVATAKSRGAMTPELKKIIAKARKGGTFYITASVQDGGSFYYANREITIVE